MAVFVALWWLIVGCCCCGYSSSLFVAEKQQEQEQQQDGVDDGGGTGGRQYHEWSLEEIHRTLGSDWPDRYRRWVRVTTAQEAYGLPRAGDREEDCPFDEGEKGCLNYILVLQDWMTHPEGSASAQRLPTVLWSGTLHGDERVGPTAVMETAQLLLEATLCQHQQTTTTTFSSFPKTRPSSDEQRTLAQDDESIGCQLELENRYGMTVGQRRWLARLLTTRRIVVVPAANALGYFRNERREAIVDPNRDFPYDQRIRDRCFRTVAARTMNEIFRHDLVRTALLFHAGVAILGYAWGAFSHFEIDSPDDTSQHQLCRAMSDFGGSIVLHNSTTNRTANEVESPPYRYGPINQILYYARGNMNDWAYAASWDTDQVSVCNPDTYGGYEGFKSVYDNSTLRVFPVLVETSGDKQPHPSTLGHTQGLLQPPQTNTSGHVPRNIRVALANADLVEPYLHLVGVNHVLLPDDNIVPFDTNTTTKSTRTVYVPQDQDKVTIAWTVGGALDIDETRIWYAPWSLVDNETLLHDPVRDVLQESGVFVMGKNLTGTGYFAPNGASPSVPKHNDVDDVMGPCFVDEIDLSGIAVGESVVVLVSARVDGAWLQQPEVFSPPDTLPQTHLVQARTNPNWYHHANGRIVQGRLDWFSLPVRLIREGNTTAELVPTTPPSTVPSSAPSTLPSLVPSSEPSGTTSSTLPSLVPSLAPSATATTAQPSVVPSMAPTTSTQPSVVPSLTPSGPPADTLPSLVPSLAPSGPPAETPPSLVPSSAPTQSSSSAPSATTTSTPSSVPLGPPTNTLPTYPRAYKYLSYEDIHLRMLDFQRDYRDFVRLSTAQGQYGFPAAGTAEDCPIDFGMDGCLNFIIRIQDYVAHPERSDSSNRLPSVFWSGAVHGDELVGPTIVMETLGLLLEAVACESKPRHDFEFDEALQCRADLRARGISDAQRKWLARLVSTRRLVVIPTANALGYFRNERGEDGVDPNRDFPYDLRSSSRERCMESLAARTINEVFLEEMFQVGISFHGGIEYIGYEWGNPSHFFVDSPDVTSQAQIALAMQTAGGTFNTSSVSSGGLYRIGTMNDFIPIRGGMEDWAYAASWDAPLTSPCNPSSFGGYPAEKTTYNDSTHRTYNILLEASHRKAPNETLLGTNEDVLNPNTPGNGHISRNLRLSLLSVDVAQPYVSIYGVNGLRLSNDVIPVVENPVCDTVAPRVSIPAGTDTLDLSWTVGGAMEIDATNVWYAPASMVGDGALDCVSQPSADLVASVFAKGESLAGRGFFHPQGPDPFTDETVLGPSFTAAIDVSGLSRNDTLVVLASARVDSNWLVQPRAPGPVSIPQTHLVQARTNPEWFHESGGKIVQGRLDWFSLPLIVSVDPESTSVVELTERLAADPPPVEKAQPRRKKISRKKLDRFVRPNERRLRGSTP